MSSSISSSSNKSIERKIRKPKIEKLRRARINSSLEQLKEILLRNTILIPRGARPTKIEKADLLEMTVRYVEMLHEKLSSTAATAPTTLTVEFSSRKHQQRVEGTDMMTTGHQLRNREAFCNVTNLIKDEKSLRHSAEIINDNKSSLLDASSSSSSSLWLYNRFNFHHRNSVRTGVGKENFINQMRQQYSPSLPSPPSSSMSTESIFSSEHHWRPW